MNMSLLQASQTVEFVGLTGIAGIIIVGVALLALFIAALVSIVQSENYANGGKALWALACFAFPFIGPVLWFLVGKDSRM